MTRQNRLLDKQSGDTVEVEDEVYVLGTRVVHDRVDGSDLRSLDQKQGIAREWLIFGFFSKCLEMFLMFLGLLNQCSLNVLHHHINCNLILDASWYDDV